MTPAVKPRLVPVLVKWKGRPSHYVCFECRKQFRKPLIFQATRSPSGNLSNTHGLGMDAATYPCPQCSQAMIQMGKNFRAPAQADAEGWEVARRLAAAGFRHGHTTGQKYPTRLKDVAAFLEKNGQRTDGEELLRRWAKK
ncbi:hypothetical protein V3W47_11810 [Deinococcus sp. YIM 134068]|uniref:hypothetical protein n=1 Tax=Deinococcus lichenicola TaxID=3118910 RepID=UPI002F93D47B